MLVPFLMSVTFAFHVSNPFFGVSQPFLMSVVNISMTFSNDKYDDNHDDNGDEVSKDGADDNVDDKAAISISHDKSFLASAMSFASVTQDSF